MVFLGMDESFIINKVIEGKGIIGELKVVEVRAMANETVDDGEVELGEVDAGGVPGVFIVFVVKEPLGGVLKGLLGDGMAIVITGVGRRKDIEVRSGREVDVGLLGWEEGRCGACGRR